MMGKVKVFNKQRHLLWSTTVFNKSFVSIKAKYDWPKEIGVEVDLGIKKIKKEITL